MDNINDLLNTHSIILEKIFHSFGVVEGYGEIVDNRNNRWFTPYEDYITFFDEEDIQYSYDSSTICGVCDKLTMFYTHENGETYYSIFNNDKLLTEDEYYVLEN